MNKTKLKIFYGCSEVNVQIPKKEKNLMKNKKMNKQVNK